MIETVVDAAVDADDAFPRALLGAEDYLAAQAELQASGKEPGGPLLAAPPRADPIGRLSDLVPTLFYRRSASARDFLSSRALASRFLRVSWGCRHALASEGKQGQRGRRRRGRRLCHMRPLAPLPPSPPSSAVAPVASRTVDVSRPSPSAVDFRPREGGPRRPGGGLFDAEEESSAGGKDGDESTSGSETEALTSVTAANPDEAAVLAAARDRLRAAKDGVAWPRRRLRRGGDEKGDRASDDDPMRWFAPLPPAAMRRARARFVEAVAAAARAASARAAVVRGVAAVERAAEHGV